MSRMEMSKRKSKASIAEKDKLKYMVVQGNCLYMSKFVTYLHLELSQKNQQARYLLPFF